MFGWRRRSEGFEWREYVRTTVLVRRADRQRKIDDVRVAAVNKVIDTKDRGVAAGRAGVETAAHHISEMIKAAASTVWRGVSALAATGWNAARKAASTLAGRMPSRPLLQVSLPSRPVFSGGADRARRMLPDTGFRMPVSPSTLGGGALVLGLIVLGGPMLRGESDIASVPRGAAVALVSSGTSNALSGRATAIKGDLLRIDGQLVRLTGIEVPEAKQPCLKSNGRRWNCSAAARSALEKMVRGKSVACTRSGETDSGVVLAACSIDGTDVADALVRHGHVFAASGLLATYGSAESEAKETKLGIWQGETVRPSEWRDQIWQEAKRAAPEGCPIKGTVRATDRSYAMPWSNGYEGAKVRTVKGDRWFCSEDEARAAGFKLSSRS
ncbi:MAG: thermonuclease family protein [Hyphomicrobium sp.]|nr:thermonuclease family protein [Hyphomicrobium sp.]